MAEYGTLVTSRGAQLIAGYLQDGGKLGITAFAVGDGGGESYRPTADMTALRRECWRGPVNAVTVSGESPNVIVIEALVPAEVGGFTIREAGVFDGEGNLIGIMNTPETQKVASADGAMTEQFIQLYLAVSTTEAIQLNVDPSAVMASRRELEELGELVAGTFEDHDADEEAHPAILERVDRLDEAVAGKADAGDVPEELSAKLEEMQGALEAAMPLAGGSFTGKVIAAADLDNTAQIRSIQAGTGDLTAGTSPLATGTLYLVYE